MYDIHIENAHHCHKLGPITEITVSVDRCNVSKHLAGKRHNKLMLDLFIKALQWEQTKYKVTIRYGQAKCKQRSIADTQTYQN
jgi:hypothetical protein